MQNTRNKIYFNFSYRALKLLGDGLYSNSWTAISELIANGIDADATKIYLYINMIDKQSSIIEIFDNGHGMAYDDLADKYALIGKNKRFDKDLNETQKERVMGRKGIGKLAALYLAPTYYLISRTKFEESSWCLDMNSVHDDEIPNIKKTNKVQVESKKEWQECKTGTLIKLVNVDLRNIGEQTMSGIKARIADYYAFDKDDIKIFIALKQDTSNAIFFEKAEKQIAFKNFYAFFNNTNINFMDILSREILLKTSFPEQMPGTKKINEATKDVYFKKCPIKILNNVFQTSGEQAFIQENGRLSSKSYKYELRGWIGIHSTIEKREAKLNDDLFLKNKTYKPNRLRLYVRNKLAVENFMEYMHNTQAFEKYIEGEIHFDILDGNELPDIATAGRQAYKENNDRVQKLIEILKPIIGALIKTRIEKGSQIRKEEENYFNTKNVEANRKTEKAQEEAREARAAKDVAEKKRHQAEKYVNEIEEELEQEKKQGIFQRSIIGREKEQILALQHQIKHSASRIKTNLRKLYECFNQTENNFDGKVVKHLSIISKENNNIESIARYVTNANFNLTSTEISEDIVRFIVEYINEIHQPILKPSLKIEINVEKDIEHKTKFRPLEITSIIDNLIQNADNAGAKKILFAFIKHDNNIEIIIADDGVGIHQESIDRIFDFGFSTTNGSGIGLFAVKAAVIRQKWRIEVVSVKNKGTTFKILI